MALLTKQQFIAKHGYDPESRGIKPVPMPSQTSGGVSGGKDPSRGFTTEELDAMEQSFPSQAKGFSTEELDAMESGSPAPQAFEPKGLTKRWTENEAATSRNIRKGEGSGEDGKRTFGETLGNIGRGIKDLGTGAVKSVVSGGVNLAQLATPDAMWGDNSILNSESERAQAFEDASKGKGTMQKIGKTVTDIGTIFAPGGVASKAGSATKAASKAGLLKYVPGFAETAAQAGKAGKLARLAPSVAGNVAESVVGGAMLGGDSTGSDVAWGLATPLVTGALGAGAKALKYSGEAGQLRKIDDAARAADDFVGSIEKGNVDPFKMGEFNQAKQNFKESMTGLMKEAKGKIPEKLATLVNRGDEKSKALQIALEGADGLDEAEIPGVLDTIWDELGGAGKMTGEGIQTRGVIPTLDDKIKKLSDQQQALIGSQKTIKNLNEVRDQVIRKLIAKSKSGYSDAEIVNLVDDYFGKLSQNRGGKSVSSQKKLIDVFNSNKDLRNNFNYTRDNLPVNHKLKKQIAGAVDDVILGLDNPNGKLSKELQLEMTRLYDAKALLEALHGTIPKGKFSQWMAQLVGSMGGYAMGGGPATSFAGGVVGGEIAKSMNSLGGRLSKSAVDASPTMKNIKKLQNEVKLKDLTGRVNKEINFNIDNANKASRIKQLEALKNSILKRNERSLRSKISFNKDRIKTNLEIDRIIAEINDAKSKADFESAQEAMRELFKKGITDTKLSLPSADRLALPEGGKYMLPDATETIKKFGEDKYKAARRKINLRDYIGK